MKVILVMVQSVNGKITRGDVPDIYQWTSKEDTDFFFTLLKEQTLIVMGSGTYEAVREKIKPTVGQLRTVMTRNPEKYKEDEVAGKLEFRNISPSGLVEEMQNKGHEQLLLVGGGELNKAFFEANLVNQIYITIEPRLFGSGKPVIAEGVFDKMLELISSKILNKNGSILLHYLVKQ